MRKKLLPNEINAKIMDRGIQITGEYITAKIKTEFTCNNGHTWLAEPKSVIRGAGCPLCNHNSRRSSKEEINNRTMSRGIQITGEYINNYTKTEFTCDNGHKWEAVPNSITSGSGCPHCSGKFPLSKEIVNERIYNTGIRMLGDYITNKTLSLFECSNGHKWMTTPSRIMGGFGCPGCANHGYNPEKPGWLYILIFDGHIKYGITNNLDRRLKRHLSNGKYTIATTKLYEDGSIAQNWERSIKIIFGGRFVSKEIMPDGYTETLSLDKLPALLDTIRM
jgi:hypothetical protein